MCSFSLVVYYLPPHLAPAWVFAEPPTDEAEGEPGADADKGAQVRLLGAGEEEEGWAGEEEEEEAFVNVRDLATWSETTGDVELAELPPISTAVGVTTSDAAVSKRTGTSPKRGDGAPPLESTERGALSHDANGLIIR